jgi:hypothetical protein
LTTPLLIATGLAIAAVALVVALNRSGGSARSPDGGGTAAAISLGGVASYDPYGDRREHSELVGDATDGNAATAWETEHYRDAPRLSNKPGVGLVLDAARTVTLHSLTITTETPGFTALIQAGDARDGPFHTVSDAQTVSARTRFELRGAKARYFVIWITRLGPGFNRAAVNEVTAR